MRTWILVLVGVCALTLNAAADNVPRESSRPPQPPGAGRSATPGPHGKVPILGDVSIGERAPDFVLDGSKGREEQLSKHRGQWLVLMFSDRYRDLAVYDSLDANCHALGAQVVSVCHEKQQTLTSACGRDHVGMLMLADATGEVSAMYGLYDWGASQTGPGFFVIDRDGVVRLVILGKLFPPDQMLELVRFATGAIY